MNLTINSQFRPFTYDEMVKPLTLYKEVYDEERDKLDNLSYLTEKMRDIAQQEKSPEAYAIFKQYSDQLERLSSDFNKYGLKRGTRNKLSQMKRGYAASIEPLIAADTALKEANAFREKVGPNGIFQVNNYDSIDSFLHGKVANNKYVDRQSLIKETASLTEAAMAEAMEDPEFIKAMSDQYWQIKQHTGGSYKELEEAMKLAIADNPIAQNRFSEIRQAMFKKYGIQDYDTLGQRDIINAVDTGLYAGLDKPNISFQGNLGYQAPSSGGRGRGGNSRSRGNLSSPESSEDDDAYTPGDAIFEIHGDLAVVPNDMSASQQHGYLTPFNKLPRNIRRQVENYLDGADPGQYTFTTWKSTATGRDRVQINKKTAPLKKGNANPAFKVSPEEFFLNELQ